MKTIYIISALIALCLSGQAADLRHENFDSLRRMAEGGNDEAQMEMSRRYMFGVDVEQSDETALLWRTRAAERGNLKARLMLGEEALLAYNYADAQKWLELPAKKGVTNAEYYMGNLLSNRGNPNASERDAVEWFLRSAMKGHLPSQYRLTQLYLKTDLQESLTWFYIAESFGGNSPAPKSLLERLSPEEIAAARKKADSLIPKIKVSQAISK